MIIAKLNYDQFIAAFGAHEYVRGFTKEAIEHILEFIEEQQRIQIIEGYEIDTQITDYFQDAEELELHDFKKQYSYADYDDIEDFASDNNYTELNNGNYVKI